MVQPLSLPLPDYQFEFAISRSGTRRNRKFSSTFSGYETASFFGFLGATDVLVFSCMGAACGTKERCGNGFMEVIRPELVVKSIVPVVVAGVLGMTIGIVGDAGVRFADYCTAAKAFFGIILILIFAVAMTLYGLIVGIILSSRAGQSRVE